MSETAPKELPAKYYLDYFEYLLAFVERQYEPILTEREWDFIRRFRALSEEGRCLFIRMVNRQGTFFRAERLVYEEVQNVVATLEELRLAGFVTHLCAAHEPEALEVLQLFTKPELTQFLPLLNLKVPGISKYKKPELVAYLMASASFIACEEVISNKETIVRQGFVEELEMLKFLFFGNIYGDMTEFVLRDLGNFRFEQFDESKFTPRFLSRKEADDKFVLSRTYLEFQERREVQPAEEIFDWFIHWVTAQPAWEPSAQAVFDKMVLRLGALLEKNRLLEQSLRIYQYTSQPPSYERQVRLLHKLKRFPEAMTLCERILAHPQNADEKFFAVDFTSRLEAELFKELQKKKHAVLRKSTTNQLKSSDTIRVDAAFKYQVEQGVIHYLAAHNQQAVHTENYLWCGFFGLLCWDIIFAEDHQAIHHPLQRAPSDLRTPQFLEKRQQALAERLEILHNREAFTELIEKVYVEKYGINNPLVGWHESLLPLVLVFYEKLEPEQIKRVMLEMAQNLKENTRGFPDLFAWSDEDYCFIEVKSPNDHLSAQQLYWLQFFEEIGIRAKVLRVKWENSSALEQE
ncbi:MAG: VRR-NUC domain-containing protein [Bacteroidota bacterium]